MSTAYITLLVNESYLPGALTVAQVLKKDFNTNHTLVILLDTSQISEKLISLIKDIYDEVIPIDGELVLSPVDKLVTQLNRIELSVTFTKILLWKQIKYTKLVYLDCDTLPVQSLDSLFDVELKPDQIAASPDSGWPDIFNSGVMVLSPSIILYNKLSEFTKADDNTFDGADQGLLNEFFNLASNGSNWVRLPFLFNVTFSQSYQYIPAFERFSKDIKVLHFIGLTKPWHFGDYDRFKNYWWDAFNKHYSQDVKQYILQNTRSQKGEASSLVIEPIRNAWDIESADIHDQDLNAAPRAIFPWEERQSKVAPSRVFTSFTSHQSPLSSTSKKSSKLTLVKRTLTKQLKNPSSYSDDIATTGSSGSQRAGSSSTKLYEFSEKFDPDESLDKVSKIPVNLLKKKLEQEKQDRS